MLVRKPHSGVSGCYIVTGNREHIGRLLRAAQQIKFL
jgi:hypothetical protein